VVLVIGGGDTGADCVGTANRQGARKVYQFEIMPKPMVWESATNPNWPYWPNILRTSSSHEEGCEREWSILTKGFSGEDGVVKQGTFSRVNWNNSETPSVPPKMEEISGTEFNMKVDLVLLAMGFLHVKHSRLIEDLGVEFDQRGNIRYNKDYQTSMEGVFTAGDAGTGASLVVRSIYHGRQAAQAINQYLK